MAFLLGWDVLDCRLAHHVVSVASKGLTGTVIVPYTLARPPFAGRKFTPATPSSSGGDGSL
ncbi:hypothetical protein STRIP9103_01504, partial [Streptomyces ipomoeae 91-03]